ncbi:hypothetical protein LY474_05200 [Myxococcus stipitatus]|uniref:hypothetical protein n=1 Tax=Myxococcus stipitatus TaxID=83455 RepID=UPI001F378337|nr:hypothetical protein [Myxococcus stipitatus]MCE9667206.1 hypothetical protein [Myxococcus stipitatus]
MSPPALVAEPSPANTAVHGEESQPESLQLVEPSGTGAITEAGRVSEATGSSAEVAEAVEPAAVVAEETAALPAQETPSGGGVTDALPMSEEDNLPAFGFTAEAVALPEPKAATFEEPVAVSSRPASEESWSIVRAPEGARVEGASDVVALDARASAQPPGEESGDALNLEAAGTFLASHGESVANLAAKEPSREVSTPPSRTEGTGAPESPPSPGAEAVHTPEASRERRLDTATGPAEDVASEQSFAAVPDARPEPESSGSSPHLTLVSAEPSVESTGDAAASRSTETPGEVSELSPSTAPAPVVPTRRAPIELDELPPAEDSPMQLASTWEFVGWQGTDGNTSIGHSPESTWADRTVDIDGPLVREPAVETPSGELPLASAWDFIPRQSWQAPSEHSEVLTSLLSAATSAANAEQGQPAVTVEHVLSAMETVATQNTLGKVLIAYCTGRFQRAFLLGESFGLVRVGHAWGPGSDSPAVSSLKVDLDVPSLLVASLGRLGPSSFETPSCAQDEAIFSSLGGPSSRLVVVPIRARGRPVAFVVADPGTEPLGEGAYEELTRVAVKAAETYDRLPASRAD